MADCILFSIHAIFYSCRGQAWIGMRWLCWIEWSGSPGCPYLVHPAPGCSHLAYSSLARGVFSGRICSDMTSAEGQEVLDRAAFTAYFHPVNLKRLARVEEMAARKGLSVAQIAVAYVMNHPLRIFSLQAPRTLEEMQQNDAAIHLEMTPEEMAWLNLED